MVLTSPHPLIEALARETEGNEAAQGLCQDLARLVTLSDDVDGQEPWEFTDI